MMEPDSQLRNLRDFLLVYNRMTEICFQRCSSNFNYRNLTMDEERCVDNCAGKLIRSNHRLMATYVNIMPRMVQRRMEEMESKAAENAKLEAAATASVEPETQVAGMAQNSLELNTDKVGLSGVIPLELTENMNNVDTGTSITAALSGSQSVESAQSVYTPPTSLSEEVHVSTAPVPQVSTAPVPQMSTDQPAGPE
ncbi:mitochondrial import inner membrane translocase subunit Tim10 B [Eucyclogobius newberryi]|uniref:mitochondrial import inner membrane translocase subunit Tim10 B n=1 Tax=Eucyclogobius newberryi TaxID=166745 RepID=UPI003B58BEFB